MQALREARRVLAPGGRIVVSVATSIEQAPAYAALAEALESHVGLETATLLRSMFAFSGLEAALTEAGFADVKVRAHREVLRWPSAEQFVVRYLASTPFGAAVDTPGLDAATGIIDHVTTWLADLTRDGSLNFPLISDMATGKAPLISVARFPGLPTQGPGTEAPSRLDDGENRPGRTNGPPGLSVTRQKRHRATK